MRFGRYADALSYAGAGLGPSDAPRMAPILRRCTALTSLDLSDNPALGRRRDALGAGRPLSRSSTFARMAAAVGEGARLAWSVVAACAVDAEGAADAAVPDLFTHLIRALCDDARAEVDSA